MNNANTLYLEPLEIVRRNSSLAKWLQFDSSSTLVFFLLNFLHCRIDNFFCVKLEFLQEGGNIQYYHWLKHYKHHYDLEYRLPTMIVLTSIKFKVTVLYYGWAKKCFVQIVNQLEQSKNPQFAKRENRAATIRLR